MNEITLSDLHKGNFYHICTNGNECPPIMNSEEDFRVATNYLAITAWRLGVVILAYCLMSNHLHILIVCKDRMTAIRFIRTFKQLYSTYLMNTYRISKQFKGVDDCISLISDVKYLRKCISYILRNPLSAKICDRLEDYRWSSYSCHFSNHSSSPSGLMVGRLRGRRKRVLLKTRMDLSGCPYIIDEKGFIKNESFIRHDITEKAFMNSGRIFISYLGHSNDLQMEYDMSLKPLICASDSDMMATADKLAESRFGKPLSTLNSSEKCAMLKNLYFNNKSSIPQLARILGLPRSMVRSLLSK